MFGEPLRQVDRTFVLYRGRKLVYFAGCDYLRLASDPRILKAVRSGLDAFGLNVAASRRTTGNHPLYDQAERAIARFFGAESAILVSNGYLTNLAVGQALDLDRVLVDDRSHASLLDASLLGRFRFTRFQHRSPSALARKLHPETSAILTDGMFAHDGSVAPIAEYRKLTDKLLWVDDSHAAGILGPRGRGTPALAGIKNFIQTVTFSKAFGVYGGAILCTREHAQYIAARSRIIMGNTPLPLPLVNATLQALQIVRTEPDRRQRLWDNIALLAQTLPFISAPIFAINPSGPADAERLRKSLLKAGIYPPFICYGDCPTGYFRFAISSEHSRSQLQTLAEVLAQHRAQRLE